MLGVLHDFVPQSEAFSLGSITVYWYGLLIVVGASAGLALALKISGKKGVDGNHIWNLAVYFSLAGAIGARLFYVFFYESGHFLGNPADVFKVWEGGMSIHGAVAAAALALAAYCRKNVLSFWKMADILSPSIALGQAIGRWGNYFNQELFGRPTGLPWGIPVSPASRPEAYSEFEFFHPAFLYESLWSLIAAAVLVFVLCGPVKMKKGLVFLLYVALYSVGRFLLEFMRIDEQPEFLGLRMGQTLSLVGLGLAAGLFLSKGRPGSVEKKH